MKRHQENVFERNAQAIEEIKQQGRDCYAGGGFHQDNPHPPDSLNHRLWVAGLDEQRELERISRQRLKRCTCDTNGIDYCRQHTSGYPRGEDGLL